MHTNKLLHFKMCCHLSAIFTIILCAYLSNSQQLYNTSTLELVHVLFRHGNRTIDAKVTYPNDPYANETYYPFGLGQLTNKGKIKSYLLGKTLRLRYDDFLGSVYVPEVLDPVSTEYNRTKMTLQLVLAGLYPPKGTILEWETELDWQPIPYSYIEPLSGNHLLSGPIFYCPRYIKTYNEFLNSTDAILLNKRYEKLYRYLARHTGSKVNSLFDVLVIFTGLIAQDDWGFKLPPWTKSVYPDVLDRAAGDFYASSSHTTELKKLSAGFFLKKIIKDARAKIENHLNPPGRKMFLYSAHDMNIAHVLNTLNVFDFREPTYAAYLLMEVHKINEVHGIKVYYQNYENAEPVLLRIPGCEDFCPFDQFVQLFENVLPEDNNPCQDEKRNEPGYFYSRIIEMIK